MHQSSIKTYRSLHMSHLRPHLRRLLFFPFELLITAHICLALLIGGYLCLFSVVAPRINSLMIYRWISRGTPIVPIEPVGQREISQATTRMFILLEDRNFYRHHGIDLGAVREAYYIDKKAGAYVRGASTIDMQLARTLFLTPAKNLYRKYVEGFIALEMDALLSKQRILYLYLNSIEWGPGVFGIERAAQYEYHEPFKKLTTDQVRRLATILPDPLKYTVDNFARNAGMYARYRLLLRHG